MLSEPPPAHPCAGSSAPVSTRAVSSSIDESGRVDLSVFRVEDWALENVGHTIVQSNPSVGKRVGKKSTTLMGFEFFAGPVDMAWLMAAAVLPGAALHVALAIQHQGNLRKTEWFPISNGDVKKFGVERDAKTRAIKQLAIAGLIEVSTHTGRSPRVRVIGDRCRTK